MIPSHSLADPELTQPAAGELLAHPAVFHLVTHTRRIGFILLAAGIIGTLGLLVKSSLGFLLVVVCVAAGVALLRACGQLLLSTERPSEPARTSAEAPGGSVAAALEQAAAALEQAGAWLAEGIGRIVRGLLKLFASLVAGVGVGLITVGIFALWQPESWEYEVFGRRGPPLGPLALGAGVGLLTTEVLLLALFWRRGRRCGTPADKTGVEWQRGG